MFDAADRKFMKMALALAEEGVGLASPNPAVGCVIVRNGLIVGRGTHEYALKDHAEVRALREASGCSRGATAYVTLEPCCHQGRTPPCVDGLIRAGIDRAVIARIDPNPHVSGKGIETLRSAGIRVDVGLMAEEAGGFIENFACHIRTGLPLVAGKVGMTLDGKIGTGRPDGHWITSPESREFSQRLRRRADALLVGIDTVLVDDPQLTYRGPTPKIRPLTRVILDSRLRTPTSSRLFLVEPCAPVLIFCGAEASARRQRALERRGAEIIRIERDKNGLDIHAVLKELGKRNTLELLVEGGSSIHWSFLSGGFLDKFYFILAPLVLGGSSSVPAFGGRGFGAIADGAKFTVRKSFSSGPDVILESYPECSRSILSPWLSPGTAPSDGQCWEPSSRRR